MAILYKIASLIHRCFIVTELQVGPSGRGPLFVDIKFKVPSHYKFLVY